MRIIVFGGDGFCGWPTSLHLARAGHTVLIVDSFVRRAIDLKLSSGSLTEIALPKDRIRVAKDLVGDIDLMELDVATQAVELRELMKDFQPDVVVHFAEQRSAPYSMLGDSERRYTVDNNTTSTHNICSAIVDVKPDTHLVHLGTMGVYGYSKAFGPIPEGYLDVKVRNTQEDVSILYPANPGSIYHMTKCLDQLLFQFYNKNWGLRVTDLHQGIVWGVQTEETRLDPMLVNRFDYDGIFGTVLNRFISQAASGLPLTVYGTGGQTRAFIHINDTARCVRLALENPDFDSGRVRIFNQVAETQSVLGLAKILSAKYGADIELKDNPRKELSENELEVSNSGLRSLGFNPTLLEDALVEDVHFLATACKDRLNPKNVMTSPAW